MLYYILQGKEIKVASIEEWGSFFEDISKRQIAHTIINEDVYVSTVFLGIDHNYLGKGSPVLFETMVFGGEFNETQWRYCSYEEAEKGHKEIVERLKKDIFKGPSWRNIHETDS